MGSSQAGADDTAEKKADPVRSAFSLSKYLVKRMLILVNRFTCDLYTEFF